MDTETSQYSRAGEKVKHVLCGQFYLEGFSYPRYYEMYRCMKTEFKRELNGIYCDSAHPFAPHELYHGFLASSEPVYAWDGDLTKFCGSTSTLTLPDASACALFQRPDIVVQEKTVQIRKPRCSFLAGCCSIRSR